MLFTSLQMDMQSFQHHFLKRSFLHSIAFVPLLKISCQYMYQFISEYSILFHWSICLFYANISLLDYCNFIVRLEIRQYTFFNFVLFLKLFWAIWGSFAFMQEFQNQLLNSLPQIPFCQNSTHFLRLISKATFSKTCFSFFCTPFTLHNTPIAFIRSWLYVLV